MDCQCQQTTSRERERTVTAGFQVKSLVPPLLCVPSVYAPKRAGMPTRPLSCDSESSGACMQEGCAAFSSQSACLSWIRNRMLPAAWHPPVAAASGGCLRFRLSASLAAPRPLLSSEGSPQPVLMSCGLRSQLCLCLHCHS